MQCPNCQEDVRKSDKHCHGCGIDLTKKTHELEAADLRQKLAERDEELKKEKEEHAKTKAGQSTSLLP